MSDDDQTATTTEGSQKRQWRDDPLSMFLAFAAVVLGGMYLLEQRDQGVLEEAGVKAQALAAALDLDDCTVGSASTDGKTLVIACSSHAADAVSAVAAKQPDFAGFESVTFVGTDVLLACGTATADWPNGCISKPVPKPQR